MPTLEMKKEERSAVTLENKGEKIFGILHLPSQPRSIPPPIVIVLHGYASSKIGGNRCYVHLAQELAKAGIGCFRFDFRGSGDSEGELSAMLVEDFLTDTLAVASYLEKEGFTKLAFFGSSFGGSMALLASTQISVQALALWAPVASGALWYKEWMEKKGDSPFTSYQGVEMSELFKQQFFNLRLDNALAQLNHLPLLHMQNAQDAVVTLNHKLVFEKGRAEAKAPTLFKVYSDSAHQIGSSSSFPFALQEAVAWFSRYL